MISRFMKDGLSNVWGGGNYPLFLKYVGTITTRRQIISRGNNLLLVNNTKPSRIEKNFFHDVIFYKLDDSQVLLRNECGYVQLEDQLLKEVAGNFRKKVDYMQSSGSIYKKKKLMFSDFENHCAVHNVGHFNNILSQKMASSLDGIIRLEGDFTDFNNEKKNYSKG